MDTGFLAVKSWCPTKQEALLFDTIYIGHDATLLVPQSQRSKGIDFTLDLTYLIENGVAKYLDVDERWSNGDDPEAQDIVTQFKVSLQIEATSRVRAYGKDDTLVEEMVTRLLNAKARLYGMSTIPILPREPSLTTIKSHAVEVAHVIVHNLPLPSNDVPWERSVEFRSDPEARGKLLGLRRWMRTVASDRLTPNEVQGELEYLLNEFERSMNYHRVQYEYGPFRTIMSYPLEIIEHIMNRRPKSALDALYSIEARRVSLVKPRCLLRDGK
jgi:hypothetical protein